MFETIKFEHLNSLILTHRKTTSHLPLIFFFEHFKRDGNTSPYLAIRSVHQTKSMSWNHLRYRNFSCWIHLSTIIMIDRQKLKMRLDLFLYSNNILKRMFSSGRQNNLKRKNYHKHISHTNPLFAGIRWYDERLF